MSVFCEKKLKLFFFNFFYETSFISVSTDNVEVQNQYIILLEQVCWWICRFFFSLQELYIWKYQTYFSSKFISLRNTMKVLPQNSRLYCKGILLYVFVNSFLYMTSWILGGGKLIFVDDSNKWISASYKFACAGTFGCTQDIMIQD